MRKLNLKDVTQYVEQNIGTFHQKRIQRLDSLKLSQVLKRKNPYLFKAKYVLTAEQIIRGIVDALSLNKKLFWRLVGLGFFIKVKFMTEEIGIKFDLNLTTTGFDTL